MKQETIDNFCSKCSQVNECGFTIRSLQYKCPQIQILEDGYELGYREAKEDTISKALYWIEDRMGDEILVPLLEQFKKEMYGDTRPNMKEIFEQARNSMIDGD